MFCATVTTRVPWSASIAQSVASAARSASKLHRDHYEDHEDALDAVEKCPTKCIRDFSRGYPEGSSFETLKTVVKKHAA